MLCPSGSCHWSFAHKILPLVPVFTRSCHWSLRSQVPAALVPVFTRSCLPLVPVLTRSCHWSLCSQGPAARVPVLPRSCLPLVPVFARSCLPLVPVFARSCHWSLCSQGPAALVPVLPRSCQPLVPVFPRSCLPLVPVFTRSCHWSLCSQGPATGPSPLPVRHLTCGCWRRISLSSVYAHSSNWSVHFRLFEQYLVCITRLPFVCCISYPSDPPWLISLRNILYGIQIMKLLIIQFYVPSFTSVLVYSDILPRPQTQSMVLRDQVSHPYKSK
jgi:hypothetical protein